MSPEFSSALSGDTVGTALVVVEGDGEAAVVSVPQAARASISAKAAARIPIYLRVFMVFFLLYHSSALV
jgi:hypothetical protein